jgi:hypothetical protein
VSAGNEATASPTNDADHTGVAEPGPKPGQNRRGRISRWLRSVRSVVAITLIVLACVLAPLAALTIFLRSVVLNTDEYLAIVGPLPGNPAVASVLATEATRQLFEGVNVKNEIETALPTRAKFLADPITSALHSAVHTAAYSIVTSDHFHKTWIAINRRVHHTLVGLLTETGGSTVTADRSGKVTLDLHQLTVQLVDSLDARGITIFNKVPVEKVHGEVTLFSAPGLVKAQGLTKALNALAWVLPFLALGCFVVGIAFARRHRRALLGSGIGLAASMGVLAVVVGLLRSYLLTAAQHHSLTPAAATVLFDAFLNPPRDWLRILFIIGVVVALGAWLAGPARPAVALRRTVRKLARSSKRKLRDRDWRFGKFGKWVASNEGMIQGALGFIAFLILVIWGSPGIGDAILVLVVAGLAMLILHFIARSAKGAPRGEGDDGPTSTSTTSGSITGTG